MSQFYRKPGCDGEFSLTESDLAYRKLREMTIFNIFKLYDNLKM